MELIVNNDRHLEEFCQHYSARIGPTGERYRRARPISPADYNSTSVDTIVSYGEGHMVQIIMPEDRLHELVDYNCFSRRLERDLMSPAIANYQAYQMIKEYENELRLRHTNPAVQRAYADYKMLVHLAR